MLHGLFGDKDNFRTVAQKLGERFAVHCLDLPNHGDSPSLARMDFAASAHLLEQYIRAHIDLPVALIGHSLGGKTAMAFACRYGHYTRQLIVVDIAPRVSSNDFSAIIQFLQDIDLSRLRSRSEAHEHLKPVVPQVEVRNFLLKNLRRGSDGYRWRFDLDAIAGNQDRWLSAALSEGQQYAGKCDFVRGSCSNYILDSDWEEIKKFFPAAEFHTVEGAGHWVHNDRPQAFVDILTKVLV